MRIARLLCVLAFPVFPASAAVDLHFFPASSYDANASVMDATLGISGYSIETFESTSMLAGLSLMLSGGGVPDTTFVNTLPALFSTGVCGPLTSDAPWDGTHAVINTPTNSLDSYTTPNPVNIALKVSVDYAPGAKSLGIGLGNFQTDINNHELFVNGQDMGTVEALAGANWTSGYGRNTYLRIDGTGGTVITSVALQNLTSTDVLIFDHIAVSPVPEPSSFGTAALGTLLLLSRARRRP